MKRKKILLYIATSLTAIMLLCPLAVLAADSWEYRTQITIKDTGGTARSYLPISIPISGNSLISAGFINSSGTDTRFNEGTTEQEYCIAGDRLLLYVPALAANQEREYNLYMGYSPVQTTFPVILGEDGYLTILDNAQLELGNNFTVELKGYLDVTAVGSRLFGRFEGLETYFSASGEATSTISDLSWETPDSHTGGTWNNGANSYDDNTSTYADEDTNLTQWTSPTAATGSGWASTANVYDEDTGTMAYDTISPDSWGDLLTITPSSPVYCESVRFWAYYAVATINSIDLDAYYDGSWHDVYEGSYANQAWVEKPLGDSYLVSLVRVRFYNDDTSQRNANLYEFDFEEVGGWGDFLALDISPAIDCGTVRFDAYYAVGEIEQIDVDLYYDSGWHDVYQGTFDNHTWMEKSLADSYSVTSARMRFYSTQQVSEARVYEVDFREITDCSVTATGLSSGLQTIKTTADGTNLKIYVDDVEKDSETLGGATVSDLTWDWYCMEDNSIPCMEFLKITVSGTEKLWFEPTSLLLGEDYSTGTATFTNGSDQVTGSGTTWTTTMTGSAIWSETDLVGHVVESVEDATHLTLTANYSETGGAEHSYAMTPRIPDRDTSDGIQDGAVTWGSNSSLTVTVGDTYSFASSTASIAEGGVADTMYQADQPGSWYGEGDSVADLPFYDAFNTAATNIGMPVQNLYLFVMLGTATALGVGTLVFTGSALIAVAVAAIVLGMGAGTTIISGWMVYTFIIMGIGILYLAKQH